jgi:tripartite ATP-independent transporter DctP family solute receptor
MLKKTKTVFLISVCFNLFSISILYNGFAAERIIKVGFGTSQQHPVYRGLTVFKSMVEKETQGALEVKLFPNSQLGSDREMIEQLRSGVLEMYQGTTALLSSMANEFLALDLPFLWPTSEIQDKVLDGNFGKSLSKVTEQKKLGFVMLNFWDAGFRQLTNNKRPINTPQDIAGLKIRVMENPIHIATFKALKADPTPIAFGELYTALQQGVVDGQENPIPITYSQRFYEVQKFLSLTGHLNTPLCLLISQKTWDLLTLSHKTIIQKAADISRDQERRENREQAESLLTEMEKSGLKVNKLTPENKKGFAQLVEPVYQQFKPVIGGNWLEEEQKAIQTVSK